MWNNGNFDMRGISPSLTSSAMIMARVVFTRKTHALRTSLRASHFLRRHHYPAQAPAHVS